MKFGRGLNPIIRWFYICGLSCYPSSDAFLIPNTKKKRFVHYIPTGALIALMTSIGSFVYRKVPTVVLGPFMEYVLCLYVLFPVFTLLVCAFQVVFLLPYFGKIWSQINTLEHLSREKFFLDPTEYRRRFKRRVYIILATFILPYLNVLFDVDIVTMIMTTATLTLRVLVILPLIQVLFYVGLLDYLLKCFVRHLNLRSATTKLPINVLITGFCGQQVNELKAEISQYKRLHFELWQLSAHINTLFGWTNVAFFLHNFFFIVFYAHNIYVQVLSRNSPIFYIRKQADEYYTYEHLLTLPFTSQVYFLWAWTLWLALHSF